jgi:Ni,Fe-hydrogenase III small subunit/Pyruvate/2-oxoacid:ferredoxin oxidoreductase delta subunit
MIRLLTYLLSQPRATVAAPPFPNFDPDHRGLPMVTDSPCAGSACNACAEACPTDAIFVKDESGSGKVTLDLGRCIGCGLCVELCPSETIVENASTSVAQRKREDLILSNEKKPDYAASDQAQSGSKSADNMFANSVHARVVSTGCSACDAEIGASGNPVFDIERFGIHIVASPRYADALMVTGPVSRGMQDPLIRCYEAMPDPRIVIAVGTCAISGGVHRDGYTRANGTDSILSVDVYIPGCPPHPWSIIHAVQLAQGKAEPGVPVPRRKQDKTGNGSQS